MFIRTLTLELASVCFQGKIIILTGPRQIGKTTLVETLIREKFVGKKVASLRGEHLSTQELLSSGDFSRLQNAFDTTDIIFIDEGQKIPNIGNTLKILIDSYKDTKQIIVTGSSSFHLLDQVSESLAGRKRVFLLYPISYVEYGETLGYHSIDGQIESFLLYGMYPAVLTAQSTEKKVAELSDLVSSALYRDILEFQSLKNPAILTKLLKILALQIGQEVSLHALGQTLSLDGRTVERYIDLLEKSYVIYRIPPYFTNKKKEIIKTQKIYFYDLGIRNALLGNFTPLDSRTDVGQMWENWLFSERIKHLRYQHSLTSFHFWRGTNQQEIDLVEENAGALMTYEMKWKKEDVQLPSGFKDLYGMIEYRVVSRDNIAEFLK